MAVMADLMRSELIFILTGVAAVSCLWLWQHKPILRLQFRAQPRTRVFRRPLTFRISNIPREIAGEEFRRILTRLSISAEGITTQPNLIGFSYSPSAVSRFSGRYAVATATFENAPALDELEKNIKRIIGIGASRLKVDLDFFGLTPLADPLHNTTVDIIAVTGLAGHAFGSWKSKNKPDMWLRDFLPESIPNARILTYGYDTKLPGSQSEASILELSRRLLESIKTTRDGHTKNRPLILIGHSLGGLVVKEALVEACEGSEDDQAVFKSCYAVMLFAVPNRGLDNSSLMSMVKGQPNEDLVKNLSGSSRFLSVLQRRFNRCFVLSDSKIICVFETRMTPTVQWNPKTGSWERTGPKVMMVPHTSAVDAGPNEKAYDQLSIDADHSEIVKFSDISDSDYLIIESRIRELVENAQGVIRDRFASLSKKLSQLQAQYIAAIKAPDYAAFRNHKVDKPTPGTLGWFLKHELIRSWLMADKSSVIWVKGSPGQGKTILAKFLLDYLENSSANSRYRTTVIYFFFYDQDDSYKTVGALLRALIKQLLSVSDAFQAISDKFDIEASNMTDESMWIILKELLQSSIFGEIYCVIDALDECQDHESRQRLLEFFKALMQPPLMRSKGTYPLLKAFLTSRPTVELGRSLKQFPSIHLKASPDDLKIFIQSKIQALEFAPELEYRAVELLSSRVEQTYLWISIILKKLKAATILMSQADMEQIIGESPSDLTDLYESIIRQIMQSNDIAAQKLLIWAVFGRRALTLNELEVALAIQENSTSYESIRKYKIPLTENAITSAAGVILEITNEKVYLIHQSAKDFLLRSEYLAEAEFCRGLRPSIYLAKICMTYLCFADFVRTGPCREHALLDERNRFYPFFRYAARNWHRHIGIKDDISNFTSMISQLTEPGSLALLAWGEAAGIVNIDMAKDAWDIAMEADIPWLAEFRSRGDVVDEGDIEKAASRGMVGYDLLKTLLRKHDVRFTGGAVCATVRHFDHGIVRQLLEKDAGIAITPELIKAAAANREHGRFVMDLLLEYSASLVVTAELVQVAAENDKSGRNIIELILRKGDVDISEEAMAEIAARFDVKIMKFLLSLREDIKINEMVLVAAMQKKYGGGGEEMIQLLLKQRGQDAQITDKVVKIIAQKFDRNTMRLLLDQIEDQVTISEDVVSIIAERFDENIMALLLERRGSQINIPDDVIRAAAGNRLGKRIIAMLLDRVNIVEEVIYVIITRFDVETMALLLNQRGDQIVLTKKIVKAAAERFSGHKMIELLLNWRGGQVTIVEEAASIIAASFDEELMTLLLDRLGEQITITEELIRSAAGNFYQAEYIMRLLLNRRGDEITITEEILKVAAGNGGSGKYIMELLLSTRRDQITITEDVVKAAVGNERTGSNVMALLLDWRGDQIAITEDIIKVAAGNKRNGRGIMALLLKRRQGQTTITDEVLQIVAGNTGCGRGIMALLLDRPGFYATTITEEVLNAAARNRGCGEDIMKFLLPRFGDQLPITDEIINVMAANEKIGEDVMALLLEWREFQIAHNVGIAKAERE